MEINKIVFDLNGTLACDGVLIKGIKESLNKLANSYKIYILTADTFGTAGEITQ
ncbi:hypothetical protein MWH25_12205 [Natroniella acetigena]|uniref:hypothetical protein n=1 Tax=Natroniella acetigena TaxID=52004 RepID=UPI00200B53C4|nr:hypothetical protein [Natroniella acetigena]MCK8828489.1 hypothetical protein [Natroniella acetigena]